MADVSRSPLLCIGTRGGRFLHVAVFVDAETGDLVVVFKNDILQVDAAPVGAKYGALIVLSGTRALPVRETPAEVARRFLEPGARNIGAE